MTAMPAPARTSLTRRILRGALPAVAAAAVTAVGFAAFTDEARNGGNRATAADVTITEDVAASSPLFDLADWQPGEGDTVARCIAIANAGSIELPLSVRLASAPTGRLGDFVDVKIERGSRPRAEDGPGCSAFTPADQDAVVYDGELDDLPVSRDAALADRGPRLASGAERAYRITWRLQDTEDAEGQSVAGVEFVWETTSAG